MAHTKTPPGSAPGEFSAILLLQLVKSAAATPCTQVELPLAAPCRALRFDELHGLRPIASCPSRRNRKLVRGRCPRRGTPPTCSAIKSSPCPRLHLQHPQPEPGLQQHLHDLRERSRAAISVLRCSRRGRRRPNPHLRCSCHLSLHVKGAANCTSNSYRKSSKPYHLSPACPTNEAISKWTKIRRGPGLALHFLKPITFRFSGSSFKIDFRDYR